MSHAEFLASLQAARPPAGLTLAQAALWHAKKGDWEAAHGCAQDHAGWEGAWVHAYLHRWEGDEANARYWYRRAGRPFCDGSLEEEWQQLFQALVPA